MVPPSTRHPGQISADNRWSFTPLFLHIQSVTRCCQFDLLVISQIHSLYSSFSSDGIIPDLFGCSSLNTDVPASGLALLRSAARLQALPLASAAPGSQLEMQTRSPHPRCMEPTLDQDLKVICKVRNISRGKQSSSQPCSHLLFIPLSYMIVQ